MPKETNPNLRDFTPRPPPQKSNLGPLIISSLIALAAVGSVLLMTDPFSRRPVFADLEPHPPAVMTPAPIRPPQITAPRRVLTVHEILAQLNTAAAEWLWIGRTAVLFLGLGVVGIFAVSSRLRKVALARDREIDLLTGIALGQQRDLLAQLGQRTPLHPAPPPWDDLAR